MPGNESLPPETPGAAVPKSTSVIILNHNTWATCTQGCLRCVQECTAPPFEVVLVDNGSAAAEVACIQRQTSELQDVRLVLSDANLGFSGGHNRGLQEVSPVARLVCFLNSDCYIREPGWNRKALRHFEAQPQLGALSLTQGEPCYFLDGEFGDAYSFEPQEPYDCESYDCEWVNGACLVVDRSRVAEIGFDEAYSPAYWEDVDLSFAIRRQGWAVAQSPHFQVIHVGSQTVQQMQGHIPFKGGSLTVEYLYERNRAYLLRKWKPLLHPRQDETASRAFIRQFYQPLAGGGGQDLLPK